MKKLWFALLCAFALTFAVSVLAEEPLEDTTLATVPEATMSVEALELDFLFLRDEGGVCDSDVDGKECAGAVKCSCMCNDVKVTVTIYPDIHGETCSDVNGRPCATSETNRGKYTNCA